MARGKYKRHIAAWTPIPIFRKLEITERQAVKILKLYLKNIMRSDNLNRWEKNPKFNSTLVRTEICRWEKYFDRKMPWLPILEGHDYPYTLNDIDLMLAKRDPIKIKNVLKFLNKFDRNMIVKNGETLTIDGGGQLIELILDGI